MSRRQGGDDGEGHSNQTGANITIKTDTAVLSNDRSSPTGDITANPAILGPKTARCRENMRDRYNTHVILVAAAPAETPIMD